MLHQHLQQGLVDLQEVSLLHAVLFRQSLYLFTAEFRHIVLRQLLRILQVQLGVA